MNAHYPMGTNPLPENLVKDWTEFLTTHSDNEAGLNTYPEVFAHPLLFPLQRKREMQFMMETARSISPQVVFEIGADKGGGLYHWIRSLPTVRRVICCEVRGTPYSDVFQQAFPNIDFLWLPDSSYSSRTFDRVAEWLQGALIDCLFIDGDKCHFDTDFNTYRSLMSSDGLVFMHDIQDTAPREGYDYVLRLGYEHHEYINTEESIEACERQDAGIPASTVHEEWLRHWHGRSAGVGAIYMNGVQ